MEAEAWGHNLVVAGESMIEQCPEAMETTKSLSVRTDTSPEESN